MVDSLDGKFSSAHEGNPINIVVFDQTEERPALVQLTGLSAETVAYIQSYPGLLPLDNRKLQERGATITDGERYYAFPHLAEAVMEDLNAGIEKESGEAQSNFNLTDQNDINGALRFYANSENPRIQLSGPLAQSLSEIAFQIKPAGPDLDVTNFDYASLLPDVIGLNRDIAQTFEN